MPINSVSNHEKHESSLAVRLLIGAPTLLAVMAFCAWVAWATNGFSSELAPHGWFSHGMAYLLGIVFCGGVEVVLGGAMLWVLGVVAMVLGEGVITGWWQVRQHGK